MGVVVGEWHFTDGGPPSFEVVAATLHQATGREVRLTHNGLRLELLPLHVGVFEPHTEDHLFSVRGFAPPHPYLWENLDRVLNGFGGICQTDDPICWLRNPANAALRTRWENLSARDRYLLSLPPFGAATRRFDRFLSHRRGGK